MKKHITLLALLIIALASASCDDEKSTPPPVIVEAPDYTPIAEGWKVQSYALIGIVVIVAIVVMGKGKED